MTAASARHNTKMGDICAARSKVDSMLGEANDEGQETGASGPAIAFDRTAMIALRQARGRWSDDPSASAEAADGIVVGDDEPLAFAVLDLPSFDLRTSIAVRDQAAHEDRKLRLEQMARRADGLRAQLEAAAEEIELADEANAAIDLREPAEVIDLDAEAQADVTDAMADVVAAIRELAALRDAGRITTPEFDERMTDLLARV